MGSAVYEQRRSGAFFREEPSANCLPEVPNISCSPGPGVASHPDARVYRNSLRGNQCVPTYLSRWKGTGADGNDRADTARLLDGQVGRRCACR